MPGCFADCVNDYKLELHSYAVLFLSSRGDLLNSGKDFEAQWKASVPDDVLIQRMSDPAQSFFGGSTARFSPNNPYDFFMYKEPNLFCIELKSKKTSSFTFWRKDFDGNQFDIKKHQILGLQEASKYSGVIAGLVMNFRKVNRTYFIHIEDFIRLAESITKKSVNEDDVIAYGAVLVDQTLKKVKYHYHIDRLIQKLQGESANV